MNKKTKNSIIIVFAVVFSLSVYAMFMYGLADFNDLNNDSGLRFDENNLGYTRPVEYPFNNANDTKRDIGRATGEFLWETRAIDVILVGIVLLVAAESASAVVKGIEEQKWEFRHEMCDTDKYIILEEKETEEEK